MKKTLSINQIKPNPNNPRIIKDDKFHKLVQSIKDFPEMLDTREVVVNKDHIILGGNMRFKAAKEAGLKEIPVKIVDWDEDKQREFIIKDNVSGGEWDWDLLANEWDADELEEWGLDTPDDWEEETEVEEDEAPEVDESEPPKSKLGEVYQLGRHRVMCGDSTDRANVELLMDGEKADIAFTSPPYNAKREPMLSERQKQGNRKTVNKYRQYDDDNENYYELLSAFNSIALENARYSFVNIQLLAGNKKDVLTWLYSTSESFVDIAFWKKNQVAPAMAENVMNSQVELVVIFGGNGSRAIDTASFGRGSMSNLVETNNAGNENENADKHNATFPIAFAGHFVQNFTSKNMKVLDLFLGTGTTLIACEQTDRTCYGMELDPKYVDVIRKRYHKFVTGSEEGWEDGTPAV